MIEKYFRDGIRYKWNAPKPLYQAMDGTIVDNSGVTPLMIYDGLDGELVDPELRMFNVSTLGLVMRMPIQYVWLDYNLGRTARCAVGPYDILTGFMSGCLITRWTDRGVSYVGHVGTVENKPDVNRNVKGIFARAMPANVTGFNPAAAWDLGDIQLKTRPFKQTPFGKIMALVTTTGDFYSILMLQIQVGGTDWCVGGIKKIPPLNRDGVYLELRKLSDN